MSVQERARERSTASSHLNDIESKQLLREAGLTVTETRAARSAEEATAAANVLGFPVVLKPLSRQDIPAQFPDGTRLVVGAEADVQRGFDAVQARVAAWDRSAAIEGLAVQKLGRPGIALRIQVLQDPILGATIAFSFGRQAADIWEDIAYRVVPLVQKDARLIVREPKAAKRLLHGYGMLPAPDVAHIEEALLTLSKFVEGTPDLLEVEIDPVIAGRDGVVVEEARVVLRGLRTA
ncbi:MAG: acetate--CoA ligase family protein [Chloroflexi bacterium]|nr:acetate--CoA ligase family protein [Chloroflexota bacterium]